MRLSHLNSCSTNVHPIIESVESAKMTDLEECSISAKRVELIARVAKSLLPAE